MSYQPTSRDAYAAVTPVLGAIDTQIVTYITRRGGATSQEIEDALGLKHQTVSAQITHLVKRQVLESSGETRKTGRTRCIVWQRAARNEGRLF